jgi:hypothetical protein
MIPRLFDNLLLACGHFFKLRSNRKSKQGTGALPLQSFMLLCVSHLNVCGHIDGSPSRGPYRSPASAARDSAFSSRDIAGTVAR